MKTVQTIRKQAVKEWDLKKAGQRLLWRLQPAEDGYKSFKPNDNDFAALKCILTFVNNQLSEVVNNNKLFAKLYIYHLTMNIRYYETTVLDPFPSTDLHKLLDRPLAVFYKAFYKDLIDNQLNKLTKYAQVNDNIDFKIAQLKSGEIILEDALLKKYKTLDAYVNHLAAKKISDQQQIDVLNDYSSLQKTFTLDHVANKLGEDMANALNRFS